MTTKRRPSLNSSLQPTLTSPFPPNPKNPLQIHPFTQHIHTHPLLRLSILRKHKTFPLSFFSNFIFLRSRHPPLLVKIRLLDQLALNGLLEHLVRCASLSFLYPPGSSGLDPRFLFFFAFPRARFFARSQRLLRFKR